MATKDSKASKAGKNAAKAAKPKAVPGTAKATPKAKSAPKAAAAPKAAKAAKAASARKGGKVAGPAKVTKVAAAPKTPARKSSPRAQAKVAAPAKPEAIREERAPVAEGGPEPELDPVSRAKLAVGPDAEVGERTAQIPWSYGSDRLTAAAIDPDRMFAYWEVTDPAIERARTALGAGGPGAWLALRVYDTTGLIFDGTNAHSYFDHTVDRATRQWFFQIGRPTSTAVVELGMKSSEGFFAKIVRSGRVDFPRREPAPWGDPEWMTVRPWTGEVADVHRSPAPPAPVGGADGSRARGLDAIAPWILRDPVALHEVVLRHLLEAGWERVEWGEAGGEGYYELEGRVEWESPHLLTSWEAGPFAYPVEIGAPQAEQREGRAFAYRAGDVTHVVEGPWQVVIRNLGARTERAVVGRWEIHRSWSVQGGRAFRRAGKLTAGMGASEQHWSSGSDARLAGASERWRIGASELAWRGASEQLHAGASQWMYAGASERAYGGASEGRLAGASEHHYAGGSESRLGASDNHYDRGPDAPLPFPPVEPKPAGRKE